MRVMSGIHSMNPSDLDLNLLRALDALVRERSVTKAGLAMGLSQPAMSNALGRLREALGDPVLVRTPTGMQPTPRALELVGPVRQALALVSSALARREPFDPRTAQAAITVAGTDHAAFVLLPSLARALHEEAPGVTVEFTPWRGAATTRELQAGAVDLVLGVGELDDDPSGLYKKRLFGDRFVCVVRRGHPGVGRKLTLDRYLALPHVLVSPRGGATGLMDTELAKIGKRRRVAFVVPNFLLGPIIVAQTDYIVTISEHVAKPFAELLPLDLHEPPIEVHGHDWYCLWHERTHRDPAHRWLRQRIVELSASADERCRSRAGSRRSDHTKRRTPLP
jgi:DNA-binding transcriptional LysR family regulator